MVVHYGYHSKLTSMTTKTANLIQGIETIIVRVSDYATSLKWFTDNLGFKLQYEDLDLKLGVLNTGGATSLTVWQRLNANVIKGNSSSYPIFKTDDIESLRNQLLIREVKVGDIYDDGMVRYFNFFDPDGNVMEACQVLN
jgi:catechol 2,3-dioxygenase-like lactoylglutathione lyase family enzyme